MISLLSLLAISWARISEKIDIRDYYDYYEIETVFIGLKSEKDVIRKIRETLLKIGAMIELPLKLPSDVEIVSIEPVEEGKITRKYKAIIRIRKVV